MNDLLVDPFSLRGVIDRRPLGNFEKCTAESHTPQPPFRCAAQRGTPRGGGLLESTVYRPNAPFQFQTWKYLPTRLLQPWRRNHHPNGGSSSVSKGDFPPASTAFRAPDQATMGLRLLLGSRFPPKGIDHVQQADILRVADASPIWGSKPQGRDGLLLRRKSFPMRSPNGLPLRQDP